MKRFSTLIAAVLFAALCLTGCSGKAPSKIAETTEAPSGANEARIIRYYNDPQQDVLPMEEQVPYMVSYSDIKNPCPLGDWCGSFDENGNKFLWRIIGITRNGVTDALDDYNETHGDRLTETDRKSYVLVTYQIYIPKDHPVSSTGEVMVDPLELFCYSQNGDGFNTLGSVKYTSSESYAVSVVPGEMVDIRCICPAGVTGTNVGLRLCYGDDRSPHDQSFCGLFGRGE